MRFRLIGPFEVVSGEGHTHRPGPSKVSRILALLALRPRVPVPAETLIRELWGENPPPGAPRALQTHIYHARRILGETSTGVAGKQLLVTKAPGYQLDVEDGDVDFRTFELLVRRGQSELAGGAMELAFDHVTRALAMWRGPMLSDLPIGAVIAGHVGRAEELRIRALEMRVEIDSHLGRFRELLPTLYSLVDEYPLHEWFHGQLVRALHRSGRSGEAIQAYKNLHRILEDELGLEPSAELRELRAGITEITAGGTAS